MDEIAAKLTSLIDEYGPRSVAVYLGTNGLPYPASALMANAFIRAIKSPMFFTVDSWLLVGTNPVVSKAIGIPAGFER
jgi:hypothetical protein